MRVTCIRLCRHWWSTRQRQTGAATSLAEEQRSRGPEANLLALLVHGWRGWWWAARPSIRAPLSLSPRLCAQVCTYVCLYRGQVYAGVRGTGQGSLSDVSLILFLSHIAYRAVSYQIPPNPDPPPALPPRTRTRPPGCCTSKRRDNRSGRDGYPVVAQCACLSTSSLLPCHLALRLLLYYYYYFATTTTAAAAAAAATTIATTTTPSRLTCFTALFNPGTATTNTSSEDLP